MPYALFSKDAKLSKAYPTEADVWKHARQSGLVVDVMSEEEQPSPRPVLDNDYEIRSCRPDPQEDPARNQAEAEREAKLEIHLGSLGAYVPSHRHSGARAPNSVYPSSANFIVQVGNSRLGCEPGISRFRVWSIPE